MNSYDKQKSSAETTEPSTVPRHDVQPERLKYVILRSYAEREDYQVKTDTLDEFSRRFVSRGHPVGPKGGSAFVAATFRGPIAKSNVATVTALVLDFDNKGKDGRRLENVVTPEWVVDRLGFRGIAHTSYSHSPEWPRFRIIYPLAAPLRPDEFSRLWAWASSLLDGKCDQSCKNPDHLYYLPRSTQDAKDAGWHWIRDFDGPLLSMTAVPRLASEVPAEARIQTAGIPPTVGQTLAKQDAKQVLKAFLELPIILWANELPAEVSYEVWRGIATNLAAIAADSGDAELNDACMKAFLAVSSRDAKRYSEAVARKVFEDACASAKTHGPMTYQRMLESGLPEQLVGKDRGKAPIVDAMSKAGGSGSSGPKSSGIDFLFDVQQNKYIMRGADGTWSPGYVEQAFKNYLLIEKRIPFDSIRSFLASIRCFNFREAVFDSTEQLPQRNGFTILNTYHPSTIEPSPGKWNNIDDVVLNLVGGELAAKEYVLDWLALPLQSLRLSHKPLKMMSALVFHGIQGSGKGTLERLMRHLYGSAHVVVLNQDAVDARFNGEIIDKLFVVANEVISSTNRSAEATNKLKAWITDDVIAVEKKYTDTAQVRNTFNIIFCSNDDRPVVVDRYDRRFSVFESKMRLPHSTASAVFADLNGPKVELAAFLDHLLNRRVSIRPGELFTTAAKEELRKESLPSEERFVKEIEDLGWLGVANPWVKADPGRRSSYTPDEALRKPTLAGANGFQWITAETLAEVYTFWCNSQHLKPRRHCALIKALKHVFPQAEPAKHRIDGISTRLWKGIPLYGDSTVSATPVPQSGPATSTFAAPVSGASVVGSARIVGVSPSEVDVRGGKDCI